MLRLFLLLEICRLCYSPNCAQEKATSQLLSTLFVSLYRIPFGCSRLKMCTWFAVRPQSVRLQGLGGYNCLHQRDDTTVLAIVDVVHRRDMTRITAPISFRLKAQLQQLHQLRPLWVLCWSVSAGPTVRRSRRSHCYVHRPPICHIIYALSRHGVRPRIIGLQARFVAASLLCVYGLSTEQRRPTVHDGIKRPLQHSSHLVVFTDN